MPFRAPNANAFAERWIRSIHEECLDKLIIINQKHLRSVVREYIDYYNTRRPIRALSNGLPYQEVNYQKMGWSNEEKC